MCCDENKVDFSVENPPKNYLKKSTWKYRKTKPDFPPCLTKSRFSGRVTVLGSKSRAFLKSAQNFEEDEVGFILSSRFLDTILGDFLQKK